MRSSPSLTLTTTLPLFLPLPLPPPPPLPLPQGALVTYYDASQPPTLAAVTPAYVHAAGGGPAGAHPALLTLRGANFAPTAGLACHVGDTESQALTPAPALTLALSPNLSPNPNPSP